MKEGHKLVWNTIKVTHQHLKKPTWNESPRIVLSPLTSSAQPRWAGTCPSANQCVCMCVCACVSVHVCMARADKTSLDVCPVDVTIPWGKVEPQQRISGRATTTLLCDSSLLSVTSPHRPSAFCSGVHCCHTALLNSHYIQYMHTLFILFSHYGQLISLLLHYLWKKYRLFSNNQHIVFVESLYI